MSAEVLGYWGFLAPPSLSSSASSLLEDDEKAEAGAQAAALNSSSATGTGTGESQAANETEPVPWYAWQSPWPYAADPVSMRWQPEGEALN